MENLSEVGQLRVHLVEAKGIYGADLNGKSDAFAVISLRDVEFETAVIKKTLHPEWNESFVFKIEDISDVLNVSLWDQDRFNDPEFLGQVAVPIFSLEDGCERTFALKDEVKLTSLIISSMTNFS